MADRPEQVVIVYRRLSAWRVGVAMWDEETERYIPTYRYAVFHPNTVDDDSLTTAKYEAERFARRMSRKASIPFADNYEEDLVSPS